MKKVLVVEDNEDDLRLISYALEREGYEVISAGTGRRGAELAVEELPAFVIMDIALPQLDGIEAIRRIRESGPASAIPIVAITSYAMSGDEARIIAAGCSGYFEKPIDPLSIVEDIRKLLSPGKD